METNRFRHVRLAGALALILAAPAARAGSFDGWGHRVQIAFTNPVQGALTNFPALVVLGTNTIEAFAYGQFRSPADGADLRFADASQSSELNYEIESWDTNGRSHVWVQVPTIFGTNDFIYAYWGGEGGAAPYTTNGATWTNGFRGVWHLAGSGSTQADSTPGGNAAAPHGGVATASVGMVSGAVRLNGTNGYLSVAHNASLALTNNFVIETWFKMDGFPPAFAGLVAKSPANYSNGWFLTHSVSAQKYTSYILTAGQYMPFAGTPDLGWHYLAFRFQGGVRTLFIDGVQTAGSTSGTVIDSGTDLLFGRIDDGHAYYLNGLLDEIRVSGVPRASNWVHACWLNQRSNAAFCRYGPAETMSTNLAVQALSASRIGPTNATLNGRLMGVGAAENPLVSIGWGEEDAGTNDIAEWPHSAALGTNWGAGEAFGTNVAGLSSGQTYAYRCYASNSAGRAWSGPVQFTTISLPSVTNTGATAIGPSSARLQGEVTGTGGETPRAWILYGLTGDAATNVLDVGPHDGPFSAVVMGLLPEAGYTYRVMASNSAGAVWSSSRTFVTDGPIVRGAYRVRLSFPSPVPGALTNFPVLVMLGTSTIPTLAYSQFASPADGADLCFADATETTILNHEIEKWNSNSSSHVWVEVPAISSTNDFIYAYWGASTSAASGSVAGAVWTNGFGGVWHLAGTGATQPDSTVNGNTAVPHGAVVTGVVGMIDGAVRLDGATGYLSVEHSASIALTNNFTVEAWFKRDAYGAFDGLVSKLSDTYTRGWNLNFDNNSRLFGAYIPSAYRLCDGASRQNDLAWHYFVLRVQSGFVNLFLDGVQQSVNSAVTIIDSGKPMLFGRFDADVNDHYLNGSMDEIRCSGVPRGSNWLYACWLNQRPGSTFVAYGVPTANGLPHIRNEGPSDVTLVAVTMNGYLTSAGGGDTTAYVFWGTNDPGPTWTGWSSTNRFPAPAAAGALSSNVPIAEPRATYYYRFYATNGVGDCWSDPAVVFGLPLVNNGGGALNVSWSTATLQGAINGYPTSVVYICWGDADHGTNRGLWQHEIALGMGANWTFATNVPVASGSTNYYRCFASNVFGDAWAAYSVAFTSPVVTPAVIDRFSFDPAPARSAYTIVFDGNSWVYGSGSTGGSNFPAQTKGLLQDAGKTVSILNYGVAGQTIAAMQSDAPTQIDPRHTNYDILVGLEVVNQWGQTAQTKEQVYAAYRQYFVDRKAAGFACVLACTPHDQGFYGRGDWAVVRPYCIAQMKAEFPALGIGVIDCGSDPRLSDWTDTTYFSADKIHLNNAGQAVQAEYTYQALMNGCQGDGPAIAWTGTNGWSYSLQQTPTLLPAAWSNVPPHTNMAGSGPMAITNIPVGTNRTLFLRVLSVEAP